MTTNEERIFEFIYSAIERVNTYDGFTNDELLGELESKPEWDEIMTALELKEQLDKSDIITESGHIFIPDIIESLTLRNRLELRLREEESKDMSPECMGCEICYLKTELKRLLEDIT